MFDDLMQSTVEGQMTRLAGFRHLLDQIFQDSLSWHDRSERSTLLLASILKVEQSGRAVEALAHAGCVEEIEAIGRTMIEVTVNAAYLQCADAKETRRFLHFHPEAVQHYSQTEQDGWSLGSEIKRRLGSFMMGSRPLGGRTADPNWSSLTLLDRARYSDDKSQIAVMTPLVQRCYGKGHAAVHGTIAALDNFVGEVKAMAPARVDVRLATMDQALFNVNLCLLTMCMYLNGHMGLGMDRAIGLAASTEGSRQPQGYLQGF